MKNELQLFNTRICAGADALLKSDEYVRKNLISESKIILVDENTKAKCLPALLSNCKSLKDAFIVEVKSGEQNKTLESAQHIWQQLNDKFIDRNAVLINLGGGVITDLGSFCASTYKRGIKFINVPTTLLGMVDAAIGGKTAVDFHNYKNVIGTYSHPEAIFIWKDFLTTLDERNIKCGLAEMLKHVLLSNEDLWIKMNVIGVDMLSYNQIFNSVKVKCNIVKKDPLEKSIRKTLNFGHTTGHAIETWSATHQVRPMMHGECVAIGMVIECFLSNKILSLEKIHVIRLSEYIEDNYNLKKFDSKAITAIIKLMQYDKKNNKSKINFTLLESIGNARIDNYCDDKLIREAFRFYNSIAE